MAPQPKPSLQSIGFFKVLFIYKSPRGEPNHRGEIITSNYVLAKPRYDLSTKAQEHPLVAPHVSHFSQVPFRTIVKFWHSEHMLPV